MVRILHMSHHDPLTREMFQTNDGLRFDLEYPEQAVIIPTRYNSRIALERDVQKVIEKIKEARERFSEMGRNKTLSNRQVRTTLEIAKQIVEAMNTIIKRYYKERQEGLNVKKQREYAAIKETGMAKALKQAEIAFKYHLDLQEKCFNYQMAKLARQMLDALDKLRRYSFEALSISNGNEPLWGTTLF
ncbi:uncharacterized protein FTJAE_6220 [Fusarium tjaetaba]|uniref:Uncharacterized protein n=1 Tax=Fusarium tjaetaba TaxID=1567544 RepID=A0A8H5VW38_9HYPO|nr:uncharacterized protein FTJAE_6220 [Fusarium tjaetaba]KAF5635599.1 hypothetical protein FTJAE_6220 [Fusarium tjaetaba]